jgi:hypothetical protein
MVSLLSVAYMVNAKANCFWLLRQEVSVARSLALLSAGRSRPARIAMMAMTTSSSIRVKAFTFVRDERADFITKIPKGTGIWD